ncbi:lysine-2,3-aminomutase-like protein [Serratia odorifera]|uniref:Lysine-2,3-aminomutase-like protein n=1 Tax=Serratia odorifera TaxID=618 RepID=A0A447KN38_SEROD|nr:lysine-2,3-aminomutase-like protein [Serratia odorifera]
MAHIITQNIADREEWLHQLADVITDPDELLQLLSLNAHPLLPQGREARRLFPLRVPRAFAARMRPGDANDPLLRQVLTASEEFVIAPRLYHRPA